MILNLIGGFFDNIVNVFEGQVKHFTEVKNIF